MTQEHCPGGTKNTIQTMVHGLESPQDSFDTPINLPSAAGSGQVGNTDHSYQTLHLGMIRAA